jgi:nucleotide-binding universal stress UspA family protein
MVQKAPADALLDVAKDVDATLIVVGNQGMAGARRLLGSVPNKVSHEAGTNVLIVATRKS